MFSCTASWSSNASALTSLSHSPIEVNYALTHQQARAVIDQEASQQNSSEDFAVSSDRKSSSRIIAALEGYDVNVYGFGFENYGDEVVDELIKAFSAARHTEVYTIALWKRNGNGGHAVTPFAIEDLGNDLFAILVYDNNYPNTTHKIIVDSNTNTWRYKTSINPNASVSGYEGDAESKTLLLTPTSFHLQTQKCPFCEEAISLLNIFPIISGLHLIRMQSPSITNYPSLKIWFSSKNTE